MPKQRNSPTVLRMDSSLGGIKRAEKYKANNESQRVREVNRTKKKIRNNPDLANAVRDIKLAADVGDKKPTESAWLRGKAKSNINKYNKRKLLNK
jgi:hypothetical protein